MMFDPEQDALTQIETIVRTVAVRLILVAVFFFCLGYLVG